jgi:D-serine deaminase-like pyridoxal phosphate-dependent protein
VHLDELPTPFLAVDLDRLERNLARWQDGIGRAGPRFRPHAKTHKTLEIARLQLAAGACGLTVAKPAEAEVFADAGFADLVVAYPVIGADKWRRLAELAGRVRLGVNVDSEQAARGLSAAAAGRGATIGVHIDIDSGLGRCGLPADQPGRFRQLAGLVRELPGLRLDGVTSYRGLAGAGGLDAAAAGRQEGELIASLARRSGLQASAGSTPTGMAVAAVEGIDEVRAGTYVFNDLMQLAAGSAGEDDLALTIQATVVSVNRPGRVTVDAGSKTLSGDATVELGEIRAYARSDDGAIVIDGLTEEHGVGSAGRQPPLGARLSLVPAHVCTCVNLSDELVCHRGGEVQAVWPVVARGRRT